MIIKLLICVVPVVITCSLLIGEFLIIRNYIKAYNFTGPFKSRIERVIRRLLFVLFLINILFIGYLFHPGIAVFYVFISLVLHQVYLNYISDKLLDAEFGGTDFNYI